MNNKLLLAIAGIGLISFATISGFVIGFTWGVSSTDFGKKLFNEITGTDVEEPADTANPQVLQGEHYRLKYPGNWTLDEDYGDGEREYVFSIDSPGGSYVYFHVYDLKTDPQQNIAEWVEYYREWFTSPSSKPRSEWGFFSGEGVLLTDQWPGNKTRSSIFSHSTESGGFLVVEYRDPNGRQLAAPGFDLIESSFELVEQP